MKILDSKTINDLQKEFSELYPGLKIEFYASGHASYEASSSNELIASDTNLGSIRNIHATGDLELAPEMTVNQVESDMKRIYDLNVQIFRKSADLWLQTSTTDDWSLEKQNTKGLHSVNPDVKLYDRS